MPEKTSFPTKALLSGATIGGVMLLATVGAYVHAGGQWPSLLFGIILSFAVGASVVGLRWRRLMPWLWCLVGSTIIGLSSGFELVSGESFEQEFFVAVATLGFFVVLGFMLGALLEFIRFIHHLLHGRKWRDYPASKTLKEEKR
jgi:hypothetical protein